MRFEEQAERERLAREQAERRQKEIAEYRSALQKWFRESLIKPTAYYPANAFISELARSNRTLYDIEGNTHSYTYQEGIFYDNWQFDGVECDYRKYPQLHPTPPPIPPKSVSVAYRPDGYPAYIDEYRQPGNLTKTTYY